LSKIEKKKKEKKRGAKTGTNRQIGRNERKTRHFPEHQGKAIIRLVEIDKVEKKSKGTT